MTEGGKEGKTDDKNGFPQHLLKEERGVGTKWERRKVEVGRQLEEEG